MNSCVSKTGGNIIMADSFSTSIFKQSFQRLFTKAADDNLSMAFNGTLDVLVRSFAVLTRPSQSQLNACLAAPAKHRQAVSSRSLA